MRSGGIVHVHFLKSISSHVALVNSPLRTIVISTSFKAIFIVPIAPMASSVRKNRPISSGVSVRSRGLNMAIDEGLMSAAGLNKP